MGTKRRFIADEVLDALQVLAYLIDLEGDNLQEHAPELKASETSQESVGSSGGQATVAQVLHAMATFIRSIINQIR